MKYLYIKLGRGNRQLNYCLLNKNIFGRPIAYIFFGNFTTNQYKKLINLPKNELKNERKNAENLPKYVTLHQQIKPFIEAGDTKNARFVSIFENKVYIFEPDSRVKDMSTEEINDFCRDLSQKKIANKRYIEDIKKDIPKIMYVKNIRIFDKDVPYILRTLNVSQYYNRGTCREIIQNKKNWGIIHAIKILLNEEREIPEKITSQQLFRLLSPHQFETLIFVVLMNANIFSPAWRAGSMPDIDIIGINYTDSKIKLGLEKPIYFEKDKEVTFQIKRKELNEDIKADFAITLDPTEIEENDNRIRTSDWLLEIIKNQPNSRQWLDNSLKWVLRGTQYNSIFALLE